MANKLDGIILEKYREIPLYKELNYDILTSMLTINTPGREKIAKLEYCEAMIQEVGLAIQQNEADWKDAKVFNPDRFRGSDRTIKENSLMILVTD
nr:1980_t:CDS:2 [Entrophospora candida]